MQDEDLDTELWEDLIKDIIPLKSEQRALTFKKRRLKNALNETYISVVPKFYEHELKKDTHADIDKNTLRRFKKQQTKPEAVLDLHGMREQEAREAVFAFVKRSYLQGKRSVLIITGKGLFHPDEDPFAFRGVLKTSVPRWLESPELSPLILTYINPKDNLGGTGALALLLRRNRSCQTL